MKWSGNTRILMEMTLVKLAQGEVLQVQVAPIQAAQAVTAPARPSSSPSGAKPIPSKQENTAPTVKNETAKSVEKSMPEPLVPPVEGDADASVIQSKWSEILGYLTKNKKASVGALLVEGTFVGVSGKIVQIGYPDLFGFHLNAIQKEENRSEVEKAIFAVTGYSVRAQFDYLEAFSVKKSKTDEDEHSLEALKKLLGPHASQLEVIE